MPDVQKCGKGEAWNSAKQKCVPVTVTESGFKSAGYDSTTANVEKKLEMSPSERIAAYKKSKAMSSPKKESDAEKIARIRKQYGG